MTASGPAYHQPVLAAEILRAAAGATRAVDGTLGGGGHAVLLLAAGMEVLGIDRDPDAVRAVEARLRSSHLTTLLAAYDSPEGLAAIRVFRPDFLLLDLGVSSHQLDNERRGFSFRPGAPLDMRMSQAGIAAAEILNHSPGERLRHIFAEYGDERHAARLAREVIRRRATEAFRTSDDFVNAIRAVLGPRSGPAEFARLFQAVRIACNDELEGLERALPVFLEALAPNGVMAVISYHSGEDRIVKHAYQEWSRACVCPPVVPVCTCRGRALGKMEPRRPIRPTDAEVSLNPRARSATLRLFRKAGR